MDVEEAKAKGLLKMIGNAEVDDDYIAQEKTLCINPEMLAEEGGSLSIRLHAPARQRQRARAPHPHRRWASPTCAWCKEQELPDPNFSTAEGAQSRGPRRLHAGHRSWPMRWART